MIPLVLSLVLFDSGAVRCARMMATDAKVGVKLIDAYSFGVTHGEALANHRAAGMHHESLKDKFCKSWDYAIWAAWNDAMWDRRTVWRSLAGALDEKRPDSWRLLDLRQLKWTLGNEGYAARIVPAPFPSYRRPYREP